MPPPNEPPNELYHAAPFPPSLIPPLLASLSLPPDLRDADPLFLGDASCGRYLVARGCNVARAAEVRLVASKQAHKQAQATNKRRRQTSGAPRARLTRPPLAPARRLPPPRFQSLTRPRR